MKNKKEYYLRCRIHSEAFPDEYCITFNSLSEKRPGECFVNSKDVKMTSRDEGLVKLAYYENGKDISYIGINDTSNHRVSFYFVNKSEVENEEI